MSYLTKAMIGASALAMATPASAAVFLDVGQSARTDAGTDIVYNFDADAVLADINILLEAFGTVNGVEPGNTDTFTVRLNGNTLFSGNFNLGGGGVDTVISQIPGSTINPMSGVNGGTLGFTGMSLLQGSNVLRFSFAATSPTEDFRVNSARITAAVPEPATWAMMLLGFFAIGGALRAQRSRQTVSRLSYA